MAPRFITSLLLCAALPVLAAAQPDSSRVERPVFTAYQFEVGSSHVRDTYLTPLPYSGVQYAYSYQRLQATRFNPRRWIKALDLRVDLARDLNPAKNGLMWCLGATAEWGMMRRWQPASLPVQLAAGASSRIDGGVRYLARNSNNPIAAELSWAVGPTALANYNLRLGRLPVQLGYRASLPLVGVMFSPDYDEPYYEISLGNRGGLVHMAQPATLFRLDQQLYADLCFGATRLRLGYRFEYTDGKVSQIVTRTASHCFTVGINGEWMMLNPRRQSKSNYVSSQPAL